MKTKRLNKQLMHNLLGVFNKYINENWCHYEISKCGGYITYSIFIFKSTQIVYSECGINVDDTNFEEKKKHIEKILKHYSDESVRCSQSSKN